jgi:hypothetical protein
VGWRATKFGEPFTESVGDIFPLIIAKFILENNLANFLEMLFHDCLGFLGQFQPKN